VIEGWNNEQQTQDPDDAILSMSYMRQFGEIPDAARHEMVREVQKNAGQGKKTGKRERR
jgi:hypothetical protein